MQYASMDRIGNDKNLFSQFFCPNTIKEDVLEELEKRMKDMQRTQLSQCCQTKPNPSQSAAIT
mgnify:CR=1 FL=1